MISSRLPAHLTRHCKRALLSAALSTGVATRRRIRKAIRVFIRRHGHRRDYLARVAARVAANAALAVAILGLWAPTAKAAGMPVFDPFSINPVASLAVAPQATIASADLDADGDPDFIVANGYSTGAIRYFANTGTARSAVITERIGAQNPFASLNAGYIPMFAVGDLDGDGDFDLVVGQADYATSLRYFQNTGTPTAPAFVERVGVANPLTGVTGTRLVPTLGDLDLDGDLDLVIGGPAGSLRYFRNSGSAVLPAFAEVTGTASPVQGLATAPGAPIPFNAFASLALGDLDFDGDLDLVAGDGYAGRFLTFRNTGSATTPSFAPMLDKSNPLFGETVFNNTTAPTMVDLDADRDLDLVLSTFNGSFTSGETVAFENRTGEFVRNLEIGPSSFPPGIAAAIPLADFDGDGDPSVWGTFDSTANPVCHYFDNGGSATDPSFFQSGLAGFPSSACGAFPFSRDIDLDGDFDLLVGTSLRINSGTPISPSFAAPVTVLNPTQPSPWDPGFPGGTPGYSTFGDVDGDNDLDALVPYYGVLGGQIRGHLSYFENTGSPSSALFLERPLSAISLPDPSSISIPSYAPRYWVDFDGDRDMDIIEGSVFNTVLFPFNSPYWENVGSGSSPAWQLRLSSDPRHPFKNLDTNDGFTVGAPLSYADFDGDGDADAFTVVNLVPVPGISLELRFFENSLFRPVPRFGKLSSARFNALDAGTFSSIASADLDGDGDPDFIASDSFASGQIRYYQNTGTALSSQLVERFGSANPFTGFVSSWTPNLNLGDLDADGDYDLLVGQAYYGEPMKYFQNTGTPVEPAFIERVGVANPIAAINGSRPAPALGDLDADGDLDLVTGVGNGTFRFFRNTGSARNPVFSEIVGSGNPLNGFVAGVGFIANPALGDVDLDGDLDLVAGDEPTGGFHFFENTGTATSPAFVSRTGVANPLNGLTVGLNSTPHLVDLDGDADLDLVSGERDGTFNLSTVPEPSQGLLASAGSLFLGWLLRRRRGAPEPSEPDPSA